MSLALSGCFLGFSLMRLVKEEQAQSLCSLRMLVYTWILSDRILQLTQTFSIFIIHNEPATPSSPASPSSSVSLSLLLVPHMSISLHTHCPPPSLSLPLSLCLSVSLVSSFSQPRLSQPLNMQQKPASHKREATVAIPVRTYLWEAEVYRHCFRYVQEPTVVAQDECKTV